MTRQEAIEKLSTIGHISVSYAEDLYDSFFPKPVVPQCVADWYEEHKEYLDYNIWEFIKHWDIQPDDEFKGWMFDDNKNPIITLVDMHQFGYEVGEEKEYVIELKETPQILLYDEKNEEYYFAVHRALFSRDSHTRKELEANGFEWVFNCPGVEVKEVTDE